MKYLTNYRFMVGAIAVLSGVLALACLLVGTMAVEYNFDAFSDPVLTLQYAHNYELAKWFNLLDLFGYYLLLLPLVFYLHQRYKDRSPWMPLITFSGTAYVLIGAIGAAILTALWPEQMKEYLTALPENQPVIAAVFSTTTLLVTKGLWNILEVLFAAVWWMGLAGQIRMESKLSSILTLIVGLSTLMDGLGNIFNLSILAEIGMNLYLLLGIVWPIVIGIHIIKRSAPETSTSTTTTSRSSQYETA